MAEAALGRFTDVICRALELRKPHVSGLWQTARFRLPAHNAEQRATTMPTTETASNRKPIVCLSVDVGTLGRWDVVPAAPVWSCVIRAFGVVCVSFSSVFNAIAVAAADCSPDFCAVSCQKVSGCCVHNAFRISIYVLRREHKSILAESYLKAICRRIRHPELNA